MNRFATLSLPLCLLAGVLAACAGQPGAASATAVTLEAKEFAFSPASLEVVAGKPVKLTMQNTGALVHDFSILEIPLEGTAVAAVGTAPAHDMGNESSEPMVHLAVANGASGMIEFTPTKPGTYTFICAVAGHKEAGMTGTLTVKAP